jgi:predicted nucleic acid-binding protein
MEKPKYYFLDSYALLEIVKENQNYKKFQETTNFTSIMNLLEVHYIISRDFGAEKADEIILEFKKISVDVNFKDILDASRFRIKNLKKKLSYIDCLGYSIAINRNLIFLTGDKEFKDMENVEFVK